MERKAALIYSRPGPCTDDMLTAYIYVQRLVLMDHGGMSHSLAALTKPAPGSGPALGKHGVKGR